MLLIIPTSRFSALPPIVSLLLPALTVNKAMDGIEKMILNKKYCVDILQQTRAVIAALKSVEQLILKDHMNACVSSAMKSKKISDQNNKINEVLKLINKFN